MWKCRVGGRCRTLWALECRFGGRQRTSGPEDQRTRGPADQRTRGPADQMTGHPHDCEFQGISSQNEYVFFDSVNICFLIRYFLFSF